MDLREQRTPSGKQNEAVIITDMEPAEREYMLYLPLYDGLTDLEIGIDSLARIEQPASISRSANVPWSSTARASSRAAAPTAPAWPTRTSSRGA